MLDTEAPISRATKIIETYCANLPQEIMSITHLVERALSHQEENSSLLKQMHADVHRMSGSALCMGFPFIGQTLMELETSLSREIESEETTSDKALLKFAKNIESLARLVAYARPENSQVLRNGSPTSSDPDPKILRRNPIKPEMIARTRIMFADDDSVIRMLMRDVLQILSVEHFEIHSDGRSVLTHAPTFKPEIIITDWFMDDMGGMDILEAVRSGKAGIPEDTFVIFLTSVGTLEKVQYALGQGVDHFLVKPFSVRAVERAVRRLTAQRKMKALEGN